MLRTPIPNLQPTAYYLQPYLMHRPMRHIDQRNTQRDQCHLLGAGTRVHAPMQPWNEIRHRDVQKAGGRQRYCIRQQLQGGAERIVGQDPAQCGCQANQQI
jgi:hypothetical protein